MFEPEPLPTPDRDRLSVLVGFILLTPVLLRFVELPPRTFTLMVLGSPLSFTLTGRWVLAAVLPALACSGTNAVLRLHPRMQQPHRPPFYLFWPLPGLTALLGAVLLPRLSPWPLWWGGLLLLGAFLTLVVITEFGAVDPDSFGFPRARLALNAIAYGLAFASFTLIYATRVRSLVTATATLGVSLVLAFELLNTTEVGQRRSGLYALLVALLMGESAWALNYWAISPWTGGLLLLLLFYLSVGITQQHLLERLNRRVLAEFAVVALVALALILGFSL